MRNVLIAGLSIFITQFAIGEPPKNRFDGFSDSEQAYLKRVHGGSGALAFRSEDPAGFQAWREVARTKLKQLLGFERIVSQTVGHVPSVNLEQATWVDGHWRQLGEIETEPGVKVAFWILRPDRDYQKVRPVMICAHGHDADGWNTYAGVYRDDQHRAATEAKQGDPAVQAVKQGYIAVVPATRGLADANSVSDINGRHGNRKCRAQLMHCLMGGRTAIGERVWDTKCLLNWMVAELEGADVRRIGMLGNSGGGVLTVYVAALDERIVVAHPSCSLTSFTSDSGYIFHCDCCMVPGIKSELADMPDIAALIIPRDLVVVHGEKDTLHSAISVNRAMKRIETVYSQTGFSSKFFFRWQPLGHRFYPETFWPVMNRVLQID